MKKRTVNYAAPVTRGRTVLIEARLLAELATTDGGLTMRELGDILGCGRVDATYHCKRLAANGELVLQVEPCDDNSGIRLRAWDLEQCVRRSRPAPAQSEISELAPGSKRRAG
jgi:hypothetical protein